MHLLPGTAVDRYLVEDLLGRGGMATVWRVRHRLLGVRRALKILHRGDLQAQQRLLTEGKVQALLDHEGLLPVLDVLDVGGRPGLILPLVDGPSLHGLLGVHRPSRAESIALMRALVDAVAHAHAQGLVHRDLKPGNVLLDLSRDRLTPRIADFGLVKADEAGEADTLDGVAVGTPGYAAPEQLQDAAQVDARADLYALGVLWVELRTGRRPFAGASIPELRKAWRAAPRLEGLDGEDRALAESLLATHPDGRLSSARALAARLAAFSGDADALGPQGELYRAAWRLRSTGLPENVPLVGKMDVPPTLAPETGSSSTLDVELPRHNLPPRRDRFFGRDADLAAVAAHFDEGARLVTLLGMGGTGKTRLSVELARARAGAWPGGAWFCDLAEARDADALRRAVARALDVPLGEDAPGKLGAALVGRGRALFVLDNFEQVVGAAQETVGAWLNDAPQACFLVTSREPLRLRGERQHPLRPLDIEPGVALFIDRAEAAGACIQPADAADIQALVALLDGLPLGIELAAARARLLAPAQLLARLRGSFHGLASRSAELPARHRTLHATIQWSWELLAPWERAALAQISVFEGGFSIEAAEAVIDLSPWPAAPLVEKALAELVDKSLVRVGKGPRTGSSRFGLLVAVQAFAAEQLGEDRAACELRHGSFFARFGRPDALEVLHHHGAGARRAVLWEEQDNLVAAARRAMARGDAATAVPAALAAARVFDLVGPLKAAIDLLGGLRATLPLLPRDRAEILSQEGDFRSFNAEDGPAASALADALGLFVEVGDRRGEARVLAQLANHELRWGRWADGEAHHGQAIELAKCIGDRRAQGMALSNLGVLRYWQGRYDESERFYLEALELHREMGDRRFEAIVLLNLGNLDGDRGRVASSRAHLVTALALHGEVGNRLAEGVTLGALGSLDLLQGRFTDATRRLTAAEALHRETGNQRSEAVVLGRRAELALALGDTVEARRLGLLALDLHRRTRNKPWEGHQLGRLGEIELEEGFDDEAARLLQQAVDLLRSVGFRQEAVFLARLGRLQAQRSQLSEARARIDEALVLVREQDDKASAVEVLLEQVEIELMARNRAGAEAALMSAQATVRDFDLRPEARLAQRISALARRL